jgi:hypothetical protein
MARSDIEYIKSRFETGDRPDGKDYEDLIDTLISQAKDLGTFGNNETQISGIENATVVDTVSTVDWRWIKYIVAISKISGGDNKFYATEISILIDKNNINVSEYGVIDNDGDMGTIEVSKNGGLIELIVTPSTSVMPITVRFARMGLKS